MKSAKNSLSVGIGPMKDELFEQNFLNNDTIIAAGKKWVDSIGVEFPERSPCSSLSEKSTMMTICKNSAFIANNLF